MTIYSVPDNVYQIERQVQTGVRQDQLLRLSKHPAVLSFDYTKDLDTLPYQSISDPYHNFQVMSITEQFFIRLNQPNTPKIIRSIQNILKLRKPHRVKDTKALEIS